MLPKPLSGKGLDVSQKIVFMDPKKLDAALETPYSFLYKRLYLAYRHDFDWRRKSYIKKLFRSILTGKNPVKLYISANCI